MKYVKWSMIKKNSFDRFMNILRKKSTILSNEKRVFGYK